MSITTTIDLEHQLTIHAVVGDVHFDEVMAAIKKYYSGKTAPNVLWDFRSGSMVEFSSDQIRLFIDVLARVSGNRIPGKTAGVVHKEVGFGIARVFETFAETSGYKSSISIFRMYEDAIHWLLSEK
jgi:hypothetical protein